MTSTFKSIIPPMVSYDRDTDSIVFGRSALKALKAERWITIHSDREGGGTHVKIDDKGNITAGPAGLADKGIRKISDFGKGKEGGDKGEKKTKEAKNPHEMSGSELLNHSKATRRGDAEKLEGAHQVRRDAFVEYNRLSHAEKNGTSAGLDRSFDDKSQRTHRAAVESALRDGKTVHNDVLADYPDLAKTTPQPPSTQAAQGEGKGNDSSGKVITPEIREAAKRANMTPEAMAAHREKLSAMASDYDAKRGFTITDRTPEGYGPTGDSEGGQSSSPHDYHQSTEEMNKRNSINEAKVILRGKISGAKRDSLERSLAKMEKELADMPKASDQRPLSASEIDRDVSTAPAKKPGVPGMQTSLFDDDASGQGQLFNYVPPKKGDNKPKKTAGDASLLEKSEDDQKEHEQSRAALRGQQDMFGGAKSLTAFKRWITIHPHGKDKKGIHIEIDGDGNITKGPRHLAENGIHHVGDFGNPKRPSEEHVEEMLPHAHRWLTEQHEQREAAKRDARRYMGMNAGNLSWRENRDGRDFSSINGFDRAARQFAEENAHYGFDKDDHDTPAKVWELIREGKKKPPTMDDPEVRKIAEHWATQSRGRQRQPKVVLNAEGGEDF